jgi:hypothetical protein
MIWPFAILTLIASPLVLTIANIAASVASTKLWVLPESTRIITYCPFRTPTILIVFGFGVPVIAIRDISGSASKKKKT